MTTDVCLAIDSSCDLPPEFIQKHALRVLPITLKLDGDQVPDTRDPVKSVELYQSGRLEKDTHAETEPYSAAAMSAVLENELVLNFDKVLVITIMHTRSEIFKNVRDAVFISQPKFKDLRAKNGKDRSFRMFVFDSNTIFTGHGLMAYEAARLLSEESATVEQVLIKLENLKNRIRAFILPKDLYYLKNRAATKGDNSVSWLSYQMGNMLNVKPIIQAYQGETESVDKAMGYKSGMEKLLNSAKSAIDNGLLIKAIVMSYAGELTTIEEMDIYKDFVHYANDKGVETLLSVMSTTATINVGPGSFSLAYAD